MYILKDVIFIQIKCSIELQKEVRIYITSETIQKIVESENSIVKR